MSPLQRPEEFEHDEVIKAISQLMIKTPTRLDELKAISEKEGKDFISLVAAEALGITCPNAYLLITSKERASAKHILFGYLYSFRTSKVLDHFKTIGTKTGRTPT